MLQQLLRHESLMPMTRAPLGDIGNVERQFTAGVNLGKDAGGVKKAGAERVSFKPPRDPSLGRPVTGSSTGPTAPLSIHVACEMLHNALWMIPLVIGRRSMALRHVRRHCRLTRYEANGEPPGPAVPRARLAADRIYLSAGLCRCAAGAWAGRSDTPPEGSFGGPAAAAASQGEWLALGPLH